MLLSIVCPTGWTVYNKRCYKWLGYDFELNHNDAVSACTDATPGAKLPKAESQDIIDLLEGFIDYEP